MEAQFGTLKTRDGETISPSNERTWLPLPCGHRDYQLLSDDAAHWVRCGECSAHYYRYEVLDT